MKKFKILVSVLLSIALFIGCMPLAGLVSAEETSEDKVYTIFMAAPELLGSAGTDATSSIDSGLISNSKVTVNTAVDGGTYYYTMEKTFETGNRWNDTIAYANLGRNNNSKGTNDYGTAWDLNWIGNQTVLDGLAGLVDASIDYRITQTGTAPATATQLYVVGVHKGGIATSGQVYWINETIKTFGEWQTITATPASFSNFYSGYLMLKTDLGAAATDTLTVKTDVRNIKLTVKESNRQAINDALANTGYDFDALIAPYLVKAEKGADLPIYKANPFRAGEVGEDVSVNIAQGSSRDAVYVASEDNTGYYTYTDEYATGQDRWNRRYYFNMGYNNGADGFGWMNTTVTGKLQGKITVSMKVRVTATATSGTAPTTTTVGFNVAKSGTSNITKNKLFYETVNITGDWVEISVTPTVAFDDFYEGYAGIWFEPVVFDGTLKVDIKDIVFTINEDDKEDINTALADTDWDFDSLTAFYAGGGLTNPDEASGDKDVIWYANPDRVTTENGADVTADKEVDSGISYKTDNRAVKVYDDYGVYYRTAMEVSGSGGDAASTMMKTNITKDTEGYGWLANNDVIGAILPYTNLSVEYRLDGLIPSEGSIAVFLTGVNGYAKYWSTYVNVTNPGEFETATISGLSLKDTSSIGWTAANVAMNIYHGKAGLSGIYTIDISELKLELKASDRVYINKALSEIEGIDNIANFTEGVELATDVNGYKDYYSLLVNPVKSAPKFDVDDDGVATLKDLIRLKKYDSWLIDFNDMMLERADSNADGTVDATDIADCKKALIGA